MYYLIKVVKPLIFGAPLGMVLNAIYLRWDAEIRRFKHSRNKRNVIPKATVIRLTGKLPVI
jgi:hypothetical protein